MNENNVKTNSAKAWLLAARPKTLTAAVIPVIVACAAAWHDGKFQIFPAVVCLMFASMMQIASNLINDLYDFIKGNDDTARLGPKRATAQGWITPTAMRIGIIIVVSLACACGCLLVAQAGLWLVVVGGACVAFAFLYTIWFSYLGLGDLLVLVFFGVVPVQATYYLQADNLSPAVIVSSFACGIVIDTLLTLNNFRDREGDRATGKHTLVAMFGEKFGLGLYLGLGIAGCALSASLALWGHYAAAVLPLAYLPLHISTWRTMARINKGRELNKVLGMTSRNMLIYGLLLAIGLML